MPFINIETNLPASKFPEDFLKKLCSTVAAALGKPEDRMNLVVKADLQVLVAGSSSPCVLMSVSAIGVTDTAEKNKEHSAKIFQFLKGELGLSDDRDSGVINLKDGQRLFQSLGPTAWSLFLFSLDLGTFNSFWFEDLKKHLIDLLRVTRSKRILILFYPLEPWQIGKKGTVMSFL